MQQSSFLSSLFFVDGPREDGEAEEIPGTTGT